MAERSFKVSELPETIKKGKLTYKLVRDTNSRKPLISDINQFARFTEHINADGYLTSRLRIKSNTRKNPTYAVYISTKKIPKSERKVEISKMHGKMEGVGSLNTNTRLNPGCQKAYRSKGGKELICRNCYSMKGVTSSKPGGTPPKANAIPMLTRNTRLLTQAPLENIPVIKSKFFRFSAEGDLHNEQHLMNFFTIAEANPKVHFTIWTKRHEIVRKVLSKYQRPKNLYFIQSSFLLNTPEKKLPGYSKVFTVFTPDYLAKHPEIKINCGAKSCMSCKLCYTDNKTVFVNELLKGSKMPGKVPEAQKKR